MQMNRYVPAVGRKLARVLSAAQYAGGFESLNAE